MKIFKTTTIISILDQWLQNSHFYHFWRHFWMTYFWLSEWLTKPDSLHEKKYTIRLTMVFIVGLTSWEWRTWNWVPKLWWRRIWVYKRNRFLPERSLVLWEWRVLMGWQGTDRERRSVCIHLARHHIHWIWKKTRGGSYKRPQLHDAIVIRKRKRITL